MCEFPTNQPHFEDVETKCLTGATAALVQGLRESKNEYNAALKWLEREFGGKSRLLNLTLKSIREVKYVFSNDIKALKEFRNHLDVTVINLTDIGCHDELGNGMLLNILKSKVEAKILEGFERWTRRSSKDLSVISFRDFIEEECDIMSTVSESLGRSCIEKRTTHNVVTVSYKCVLCGEGHEISSCERFQRLSVSQRYDIVYKHKLCFLCFSNRHRISDCKCVDFCNINTCGLKHNSSLHRNAKFVKNDIHSSSVDHSKVMLRTILVRLSIIEREV